MYCLSCVDRSPAGLADAAFTRLAATAVVNTDHDDDDDNNNNNNNDDHNTYNVAGISAV